jgi:hypothetical protein
VKTLFFSFPEPKGRKSVVFFLYPDPKGRKKSAVLGGVIFWGLRVLDDVGGGVAILEWQFVAFFRGGDGVCGLSNWFEIKENKDKYLQYK